jgi:archaellin
MKISKVALCAAILFTAAMAPLMPRANATLGTLRWQNTTFYGTDSFYGTTVSAYQPGETASLYIPVRNDLGVSNINVTNAKVEMDWNGNYTASGLPIQIFRNGWAAVTLTFTVPSTSTASNYWDHSGELIVNYTIPGSSTQLQYFDSVPTLAVYTSDQASAQNIIQQLSAIVPSSFIAGSPCGGLGSSGFKTATGSADCQQAVQQYVLGASFYKAGNFTAANNALKNAQTDWNNAINADTGTGANQDLGATLGSYGLLLLGIGGLIGGLAVLVYALKRPKELRALAASTTH